MGEKKDLISIAYRRLAGVAGALGGAGDARAAAQEILDFLALLAGLKPVLLVGRGLDAERWVAGVLGIARSLDLAVIEGACWNARPPPADLPGWYAAHAAGRLADTPAWYVAASDEAAREVRALAASGGSPDIAGEARLLGYPACCVAAHYDRADAWHRLTLAVLARRAGGDEARMRALLEAGAVIAPETTAERSLYAEATALAPCPFAGWDMCVTCAGDAAGPSARLSAQYRALARVADPELAALLSRG